MKKKHLKANQKPEILLNKLHLESVASQTGQYKYWRN